MTGWIIAAVVLAVLAMLLATGVKLKASYTEGNLSVKAGFWFFWFRVYPAKEKKQKEKKKPPVKKAAHAKKKTEPKQKKKEKVSLDLIKNLIGTGIRGLRILFRHLTFKDLRLRIVVGDKDAATCAIRYGRLCGVVGGSLATAKNLVHVREKEISLRCDFDRTETECDFSVTAMIRVIFVFEAAFSMLFHFLVNTVRK